MIIRQRPVQCRRWRRLERWINRRRTLTHAVLTLGWLLIQLWAPHLLSLGSCSFHGLPSPPTTILHCRSLSYSSLNIP
ncbi:hypothetical protein J6590_042494 [Homalodisca vitripennis]|nr:hypothetical protein J6590_042494 [Homalodisca vitripennis]